MPAYRLIIDIATNRIIYFTGDASKALFTDEYSALVSYNGELPAELSLTNAWAYRYDKQQIVKPPLNPNDKPLLDKNKESVKAMIQQRVAAKLNEITLADLLFNEQAVSEAVLFEKLDSFKALNVLKDELGLTVLAEAAEHAKQHLRREAVMQKVLNLRALKVELTNKVTACTTNVDVFAVRDELLERIKAC